MTARHSCDREIRAAMGRGELDVHRCRDGEKWTCSCGREYTHVCDEAEGCAWWPADDRETGAA